MIQPFDLGEMRAYEAAAVLLATMCFPAAQDETRRGEVAISVCAWLLRERAQRDDDWAAAQELIRPAFFIPSEKDVARDVAMVERRMRDRRIAGHMAVAFLRDAESGGAAALPKGIARLSINQMCERVSEQLGLECPNNVESRVWRPSQRVLHLCAAWAITASEIGDLAGFMPTAVHLAWEPEFLLRILDRAQGYETLLARSRLRIAPDSLTQFRVVHPD